MKLFNKNKRAFTLAEVLITLVIIGVVAAITVPTIIANSKDEEIKSMLKKNHSVIAQALYRYYLEQGYNPSGREFDARTFKDIFKKGFNVLKDYGITGLYSSGKNPDLYKNYTGTSNLDFYIFDDGQFIINDGTLIMVENPSLGAGKNRVIISVDVNGPFKKPNRLGKDLFMFHLLDNGKLLPMGHKDTLYPYDKYCSKTSSDKMNGAGCTVKVLGQFESK